MWGIKAGGIVLLMAGFGSYGLLRANCLQKRVQQIRTIRLAMGILEKEINYLHTPLPLAFSNAVRGLEEPARSLFENCSHGLRDRQGITISEVWSENLQKIKFSSDLKSEDIEMLLMVSSQIGMSSSEQQVNLFRMIQEQLKVQEETARQEAQTDNKLWSYGGFIVGAAVVLLLI